MTPMKSSESVRRLRIIVALNACRRDLGGLEIAAALAARKGCELEALFVEEVNLINVAELPFTKEVARCSGTEREIDQPRVSRAQRASLSQIQQAIDRLSEEQSVQASLRIVRGHFMRIALSIRDDVELLVLSRRGESAGGKSAPASGGFAGFRGGAVAGEQPVWVIVDGTEGSFRALQAAQDIAAAQSVRLSAAVPGQRPDLAEEVRQRVTAAQRPTPPSLRVVALEPFDAPVLIRQIRQGGCRLLVVKREDGDWLEEVADAADFPVMLV